MLGDRKQAGARDRSRFYLLNPEYDPAERRKREGYRGGHRGGDRYRDREDGGYRSQRYDDREQRKRERDTEFDASIYDDDEGARAKRAARVDRRPGSSGSDSRSRDGRRGRGFKGSRGKELFPDRAGNDGRLRNRSASPLRDNDRDRTMADIRADEQKRRQDVAVAANREKAQFMKARLREATAAKELFPTSSKRSGAFDAADETADLFANRMPVPFMDGEADRPTLASRITSRDLGSGNGGFNIRGVYVLNSSRLRTLSESRAFKTLLWTLELPGYVLRARPLGFHCTIPADTITGLQKHPGSRVSVSKAWHW